MPTARFCRPQTGRISAILPPHTMILSIWMPLALLAGGFNDAPRALSGGATEVIGSAGECVSDFSVYGAPARVGDARAMRLERVSTAVPWPRGLVVVDGELIVLARGRHRNAGGIDPDIEDSCGSLFRVDLDCSEPVIRSEEAGAAVRGNGRVAIAPSGPFNLYDPAAGAPIEATRVDRPYCTLAFDPVSQNFFICGYSGVDLPGKRFRKNATDSILRFDKRNQRWHVVEKHDPGAVPDEELDYVVANSYYPHHDPETNPPPHGRLNGPDGAEVVGRYLYAVGKDNHAIVRYDLAEVRRDPEAGAPASELVMGSVADVRLDGDVHRIELLGASALASNDGYLYVGYRTSSTVVRFPVDDDGALIEPVVGELIAVFEPWSSETGRSANLIDLCFDSAGALYVSCAQAGRIWRIAQPDPGRVFDGNDQRATPTENVPYVDLQAITGNPRARCGNIALDADDRLYICSGNYESGTALAGVIYRAVAETR